MTKCSAPQVRGRRVDVDVDVDVDDSGRGAQVADADGHAHGGGPQVPGGCTEGDGFEPQTYAVWRGRWLALAVVAAALATVPGGVDGGTAAEQFGGLVGGSVRPGDLVWIGGVRGDDGPLDAFRLRRVVFAAAAGRDPAAPRDVYTALARVLPNGRIAAAHAVRNLTRSAVADEGDLVADGSHAAFAVRIGGALVGVGLVGFPDRRPAVAAERGVLDRLRGALRDWVLDGRPQGLTLRRVLFAAPPGAPTTMEIAGGRLAVRAAGATVASLAVESGELECPSGACLLESRERGLLPLGPWAADLARWAGGPSPRLVASLEDLFLTLRDRWAALEESFGGERPARAAADQLVRATEPAPSPGPPAAVEDEPRPAWPPPAIAPLVAPALPGEGEWRAFESTLMREGPDGPALLTAFVRPDPSRAGRSQVLVTIWDPALVDLGFAPGTLDPPAPDGTIPPGRIPRDPGLLPRLLAGLSGGFQAVNGQFGQVVDRRVFVPVQPWAATVARFDDGAIAFGTWPPGLFDLPAGVASVRQNLSALVDGGVANPFGRKAWGGLAPTVPADGRDEDLVPTVRSAICSTADHLVAHLWGSYLTVRSLAAAALAVRCTYAVALDINPGNAIVEVYRIGSPAEIADLGPPGAGEAAGDLDPTGLRYRAHLLVADMADDPGRFLEASERDMIYLALREQRLAERSPPVGDEWLDGDRGRPLYSGERFALRRLFPDVGPVPPTTWWPAQRETLPAAYVRRIQRLWDVKGGGSRRDETSGP